MVKQGMSIDNTPMGKMMIAILSAFAEMERDLISQRTIEGLKRCKANGVRLGRPIGSKSKHLKLEGKEKEILKLVNKNIMKKEIKII